VEGALLTELGDKVLWQRLKRVERGGGKPDYDEVMRAFRSGASGPRPLPRPRA
jgi:hypothetical protein